MIILKIFGILCLFIGFFLLFLDFVVNPLIGGNKVPGGMIYLSIFYIVLGFLLLLWVKNIKKKRANKKLQFINFSNSLERITFKYINELATEKMKTIKKDPYGNIINDQWYEKGIPYFINNVLKKEINIPNKYYNETVSLIDKISNAGIENLKNQYEYDSNYSGVEYEMFCSSILEKNGWKTFVTKGSGDQGVDIIAEKNGIKVVIQCKKYLSNVGNKSVQEIYAGKKHYHANYAAVVTNSQFTKSAVELASTNDVLLLHHNDLIKLEKKLNL